MEIDLKAAKFHFGKYFINENKSFITRNTCLTLKGNVLVYIERMLMSTRYYSIAHAYEVGFLKTKLLFIVLVYLSFNLMKKT